MIAGIDYSITSPGICIHPSQHIWQPEKCKYLFFSDLKKYNAGDIIDGSFEVSKKIKSEERMNRYTLNAKSTVDYLKAHGVTKVCIEGYAFAARSSMAVQMGENGGILRSYLVSAGMEYIEVPPSKIKKFATSSGRSDKLAMLEKFEDETGKDLFEIFNRKAPSSPIDDIADSYFICKYLFSEINK